MRFLHISDLHIGSPLTSRLDSSRVRVRRRELLVAFRDTIAFGVEQGIGAVLIAGDLFDSSNVSERAILLVRDVILSHPTLPFYYVSGNHEGDAFLRGGKCPENLYTFDSDHRYYDIGDVRIHGFNETSPDMLSSLMLDKAKKNIVLVHGELRERSDYGGIIGLRDLSFSEINYLALGHYHTYACERIQGGGYAVYSGTPEGRGFDEVGKKGVVLFDTDDFLPHFYPLAKRTLHEVTLDVTRLETVEEVLERAQEVLSGVPACDLVRLVAWGECSARLRLDEELFTLRFGNRFWHFEWMNKTTLSISVESLKHDRSLRGEFIRRVLADATLTEDERRDIIECGLFALSGEEWSV